MSGVRAMAGDFLSESLAAGPSHRTSGFDPRKGFVPLVQWPDGSQIGRVVEEGYTAVRHNLGWSGAAAGLISYKPERLFFVYIGPDGQARFGFTLERPKQFTKELSRNFGKAGQLIPLGTPNTHLLRGKIKLSRHFRHLSGPPTSEQWGRLIWFFFDFLGLDYADMRRENRLNLGIPFIEPHNYTALAMDAELETEMELLLDPNEHLRGRHRRRFFNRLGELIRVDSPTRQRWDKGTFIPPRERTQYRHGTETGEYETPRQVMTGQPQLTQVRYPLLDRSRFRLILRRPWRNFRLTPSEKVAAKQLPTAWSAQIYEKDHTSDDPHAYLNRFWSWEYPTFLELVDAHWYMMPGPEDTHAVDHWLDRHGTPGVAVGDPGLLEAFHLLLDAPLGLLSNPDMVKYAALVGYL